MFFIYFIAIGYCFLASGFLVFEVYCLALSVLIASATGLRFYAFMATFLSFVGLLGLQPAWFDLDIVPVALASWLQVFLALQPRSLTLLVQIASGPDIWASCFAQTWT